MDFVPVLCTDDGAGYVKVNLRFSEDVCVRKMGRVPSERLDSAVMSARCICA